MRVLNPNYLWTCDPYTADHNYMLSKTFKMCDPVVDDGKLDALFCGIVRTSPPGSPLSQASEVSGDENQDILNCMRDLDLKCILDDCNPAAKALGKLQVTLQPKPKQPGADASRVNASKLSPLPVNEQGPSCSRSGPPLLPSSATNLPPPVPMEQQVAPATISAEQRLPKGDGNVTDMTVAQASRPAVTSTTATTLTTTASTPAPGLSLPVCGTDTLSSLEAANTPHLFESKGQPLSSSNDDENNNREQREHVLQFGFTSSLFNGPTTQAESSQTPCIDPVPVIHRERLTSRTPATVIQFLTENNGKRKRSSNEVIEPTVKKRRGKNKGTKASPAVVDAVHPPLVEQQQPSSTAVPSSNSQNLPAQRRKRGRKSAKEKSEAIEVDQEPRPPHASPSTVIPQPSGLRQLLPASMRPVPDPRGPSMPPTHTSFSPSVAQSPAFGSQATGLPFNPVLPNNLGYGVPGVGYAENLGMPPGTFGQVANYSAQYLERQRALLLRQQMQVQLQQARGMNQSVGASFFDPRLAPNGTTMPQMLAPTTTNNGIWSYHGSNGTDFFQNSSQVTEPFIDTFGVTWTPPVQATTRTHPPNWYP
ncbi:hypothetical protein M378DRAFT_14930 [Amanita muscaria Koide BX008]|uniref:Uncharacterized protein n=1 Tax=Amanita muscaria (strain Koide BX008) TaxID=946122 RepID=A0A0C2S935_AMAMK|nr:hypothetical protein M378DRAFT_14930 [Amanita muscaria Koide BX008]